MHGISLCIVLAFQLPVGLIKVSSAQHQVHVAFLHIDSLRLTDDADYECLVKPLGGAAVGALFSLQVIGEQVV